MDPADTIHYYEGAARHYATLVGEHPTAFRTAALHRLVALLRGPRTVLEIGSGPGQDADYLASLGVAVTRTDAAQAFVELQAERGRAATLLDVVNDSLPGRYGGILALCVLMHVPRSRMPAVLAKIAAALLPGAGFLVSMREGAGESPPPAAMAFWSRDAFAQALTDAGLEIVWDDLEVDSVGEAWITFLARPYA